MVSDSNRLLAAFGLEPDIMITPLSVLLCLLVVACSGECHLAAPMVSILASSTQIPIE